MGMILLDYDSKPWAAVGGMPDRADDRDHIGDDQLDYLGRCLADVPYLAIDLEIAATRQDRFPSRPTITGDGSESPLPYRVGAVKASERLWIAVYSVASVVWHRATHGAAFPFGSANQAARWLQDQLRVLAQDPDAESLARRITDAHDHALDGPVERPPEWRYLGACPQCAGDLEAAPSAARVACECGWSDEVGAVIMRALEAAEDMLLTDTQLVGALELDGKVVTRNKINYWARSGRLTAHEHKRWAPAGHGRAAKIITVRTYRLGEVRALVERLAS